ncbi:MAG: hypothetical protein WDW38_001887 [Sanguina aurantia]
MSLYDLLTRAEHILKKYEKYDAVQKTKHAKSDDPFREEYDELDAEVEKLLDAASDAALEANRALSAAKNAEIRRAKTVLLTEGIQALQKKVKKGKGARGAAVQEDRQAKIKEMMDKIYAIPDGTGAAGRRRPTRAGAKGKKGNPIILDNNHYNAGTSAGFYDHTEGTQAFQRDADLARQRQDKDLDEVGRGVDELGDMARNMQDEVDRQAPVINDIEKGLDKVTGQLKQNNMKLKALVAKMGSKSNLVVKIILGIVLLAIVGYFVVTYATNVGR